MLLLRTSRMNLYCLAGVAVDLSIELTFSDTNFICIDFLYSALRYSK